MSVVLITLLLVGIPVLIVAGWIKWVIDDEGRTRRLIVWLEDRHR